ncbi:threonine synthase [Enterococcus cecorum]|nr:threonine synthase [Enterococcus cecorum]
MNRYEGLLKRYKEYLPITDKTPMISLCEGNTPLIPLQNLSKELGITLYGKYEGLNPTGSFKDRGMVMAVAKAVEEGAKAIVCASTGNTSAAAAAYGTRAGIKVCVVIPDGKIAMGKLAQAIAYGADIISIPGNFDEALKAVRDIAKTEKVALVNSVNPYRLEGQKTAAFEICEQLGFAPDVLAIPVGNAGNISAYWKGFKEWHEVKGTSLPRMHGFEAQGAAAIVRDQVIENPETIATAIRIGNPASWHLATVARDESNGYIDEVTDEEILNAYRKVAAMDGVFVEPGSAASLAGVIKHVKAGKIKPGETVVTIFTGNGLKDPDTAIHEVHADIHKMADVEEMRLHMRAGVEKL